LKLRFRHGRIHGLLVVMPARERLFVDDMALYNFPPSRSLKLKEVMGYDRHRVVEEGVCLSDLAVHGFENLFREGLLVPEEIDALVVVTQSPDHLIPPTSFIIQGRLGLKQDLYCLDINQGCAGFITGLMQAFMLLDQPAIRTVALVNGDVLSRKVSQRDRNSYPLVGDAVSITLVAQDPEAPEVLGTFQADGSRHEALIIPAGGMRLPSSSETALLAADAEGNERAQDHLRMDGAGVFQFVQTEVPPMIETQLADAGASVDDTDYFLFHQPNRFMLEKLADKMDIPRAKMLNNVVEHYGNSSGATIPVAMAHNLSEVLTQSSQRLCLAGFGVGLSWGSLYLKTSPLQFCSMIDFPSEGA